MPSFNTFRQINYNNPQYQMALRDKQNASDYSVNPDTRKITNAYTESEANRIRGLDDFGIANRMAEESLRFRKDIYDSKSKMAWDDLRDARRGNKLGMLIGLAQTGVNLYDQGREREITNAQLELIRQQQAAVEAERQAKMEATAVDNSVGMMSPHELFRLGYGGRTMGPYMFGRR